MNKCPGIRPAAYALSLAILLSTGTRALAADPAPRHLDLTITPELVQRVIEPCPGNQREIGSAPHPQALQLTASVAQIDDELINSRIKAKNGNAKFDDELTDFVTAAKKLKATYKDEIGIYGLSSDHSLKWDVRSTHSLTLGYTMKVH
jgi:hypothetical protein